MPPMKKQSALTRRRKDQIKNAAKKAETDQSNKPTSEDLKDSRSKTATKNTDHLKSTKTQTKLSSKKTPVRSVNQQIQTVSTGKDKAEVQKKSMDPKVPKTNKRKAVSVPSSVAYKKTKNYKSIEASAVVMEVEKTTEIVPEKAQLTNPNPSKFELALRDGPTVVCSCCLRLWFPTSCGKANQQNLEEKYGIEFVQKVFNDGNFLCSSCRINIYKGNIPRFCAQNYKAVHPIPEVLKDLSTLEERMVAARIPFMQIRQVGYARQCYITGQVINVPVNVNTSTKLLPRNLEDTHTIQVQLKRKMEYKKAYLFETVRPAVVLKAAKYLCQQPLYLQEGISISNDWEKSFEDVIEKTQHNESEEFEDEFSELLKSLDIEALQQVSEPSLPQVTNTNAKNVAEGEITNDNIEKKTDKTNNIYDLEEFEDEEEPLNPGGQETLLDKPNFQNICFAPGEGMTPIHLMLDAHSDELSFPSLFCGHSREYFVKFSYSEEVKVLLQHKDRRFARTDYLLYTFKKRQLILLTQAVTTCLRKNKNESGKYTAGEVRQANFLEKLIQSDMGFHFLSKIKGSPAYWKHEKTKLLCMIRQFGIPTIFFTISAAETAWPELIVTLSKVVDHKDLTLEEATNMPYLEKTRLIRSDPITCARYFDYRFKLLFKHMKSKNGPFKQNPVEHHYYRIEFQHRGSPHVHGLLWLADAPKFEDIPASLKKCAEFADKYITCQGDLQSVSDIIKFNTHRHVKSCQREVKGHNICRYGIPHLPIDESTILTPIKIDKTKEPELRKTMSEKFVKIKQKLQSKPELSFENFLLELGLSKDEYLSIIQHNIFKTTLLIKREPKDGFINNYNEEIFSMMKSNMDIQLVFEPYGCCSYIVNYINKSDRGVSDMLMKTMEEVKKLNLDIKGKMKKLAGAFLNASEVSAQEAAYCVLQLPMHDTCTSYVYIPTTPIKERTKILKSLDQLNEMASDDPNIYCDGLIEHYEQRPDQIENICLAEFAANYDFFKKHANQKTKGLPLKNGSGVIVKRGHAKILSSRGYGLLQDPLNHYREQIMLYIPWRHEVDEVEKGIDQQAVYKERFVEIFTNRLKFNVLDEEVLDEALKQAQDRSNQLVDNGFAGNIDKEFMAYDLDNPTYNPFDDEKGEDDGPIKKITFPTPHQISDVDYEILISKLNHKQYQFLNVVLNSLLDRETFYCTLSGPAGTGKSHLISAITQSLLRHYNSIPGNNPESLKVLLAAPTGKAAFNIGGITLHTALSLPVHQFAEELIPLSHDTVNTIYCKLVDLKLLIIDEYSMVGARMFDQINSRLQQIFKSDIPFGNIPIILCGDNRQLPPVKDAFIFMPLKTNPYRDICGTYLWDHFKYFELTEIMRQSEDKLFAIALNNMASGVMTDSDVKLIKSREMNDVTLIPEDTMHLFATNKEVDAFNEMKLSTYNTERALSEAQDTIKGSCSDRLKKLFLEHAKNLKKQDSFGLMLRLILQVNAKYMISMNIDTSDGIVNGATGILRQIEYDKREIPNKVWIEFLDSKSGKECRNKNKNLMKARNIPSTWTPIEKTARAIQLQKGSDVHVERLQFPLLISEGITIHKSQGATYDQVALHIGQRMTRSSTYVACSRATKLSGLYIIGSFKPPKKAIPEKDVAFKELVNMQTNKLLPSRYDTQYVRDADVKYIIAYQNVQSFIKHKSFVKNNPIFTDAHFLIFTETWLHTNSQNLNLDNFEMFANLCGNQNVAKPFGIICFKKKNVCANIKLSKIYMKDFFGIIFQAISFYLNDIYIIAVYVPPKLTIELVKFCLEELLVGQQKEILIIGDFNQDIINGNDNGLKNYLLSKSLNSKLGTGESTTKASTQIDWLFSNFTNLTYNIYNTVYSHHKSIVVSIYDRGFVPKLKEKDLNNKHLEKSSPVKLQFNTKQMNLLPTQSSLSDSVTDFSLEDENPRQNQEGNRFQLTTIPPSLVNNDMVSCYANSVIQSFLCLNEFQQSIATKNSNLNIELEKIRSRVTKSTLKIRQLLASTADNFAENRQMDAQSFCQSLIRKLDGDDFGCFIKVTIWNNVQYCEGNNEIYSRPPQSELDSTYILHFPENSGDIIDFNSMFMPHETQVLCPHCNQYLKTRSFLDTVGKYIVICLQRATYDRINNVATKIHTKFFNFDHKKVYIDSKKFRVKSVVRHHGQTITSGHYTSVVNYNNQWWECNDETITIVPNFDDTLKDVYLLILELIPNRVPN